MLCVSPFVCLETVNGRADPQITVIQEASRNSEEIVQKSEAA